MTARAPIGSVGANSRLSPPRPANPREHAGWISLSLRERLVVEDPARIVVHESAQVLADAIVRLGPVSEPGLMAQVRLALAVLGGPLGANWTMRDGVEFACEACGERDRARRRPLPVHGIAWDVTHEGLTEDDDLTEDDHYGGAQMSRTDDPRIFLPWDGWGEHDGRRLILRSVVLCRECAYGTVRRCAHVSRDYRCGAIVRGRASYCARHRERAARGARERDPRERRATDPRIPSNALTRDVPSATLVVDDEQVGEELLRRARIGERPWAHRVYFPAIGRFLRVVESV